MQHIRWGIIGCGDVTEVKSGPAFNKATGSELAAVMRRNGVLARDYAQRHNVPRWYDDANALINDPDVNAIYVATPPSSHEALAIAALQAGKPTYVEKPMALTFEGCQNMLAASDANGVPLFVAYYRRALPRFLKIKQLLDEGAIGDIRAVNIKLERPLQEAEARADTRNWRLKPEISGGGHFVDLAAHMLDLVDFYFGRITQTEAFASNQANAYRAEDIVSTTFLTETGVHGTGSFCFSGFEPLDETEIIGNKGRILFATFDYSPINLHTKSGHRIFEFTPPSHIQQPLIQSVVDTLLGNGTCPSTGQTAARTSHIIDQMLSRYSPQIPPTR